MIDEHELLREEVAAHALGALDDTARERLEVHLAGCAECRRLLAEYRQTADELPFLLPVESPPANAWERIESRIRGAPAAAPRVAAGIAAAPARPGGTSRWRSWLDGGWGRLVPALAGAAALALVSVLVVALIVRGAGSGPSGRTANSSNSAAVRQPTVVGAASAAAATGTIAATPPAGSPPASVAAVGLNSTPAGTSAAGQAASATSAAPAATRPPAATAAAPAAAATARPATPAPAVAPARPAIVARTATPAVALPPGALARAATAVATPIQSPQTGDDLSGVALGAALVGLLLVLAGGLLLRRGANGTRPTGEPNRGRR